MADQACAQLDAVAGLQFDAGFAIAAACCWHGLNPPDLTQNSVPKVVTRAVTQSAMLVLLINAVFAYLVFGILFFGLVKANL